MNRVVVSCCCCAILTGGCVVGPNYQPPTPVMPDAWHQDLVRGITEGESNLQTWWTVLEDPMLDDLIERARNDNYALTEALWRVRQARSFRGIAEGELYPTLGGNAQFERIRLNPRAQAITPKRRGSVAQNLAYGGAIFGAVQVIGQPAFLASTTIPPPNRRESAKNKDLWTVGVDSSWEIDVFGRIQRTIESAEADLGANIEGYRDTMVSLFAEVAINYVEVRTLQARLDYARSNAQAQRETLGLTRSRREAGLVPDLDVAQAESNLANTEAEIPSLESRLAQAIYRLSVLIGQEPAALYDELVIPQDIPVPPDQTAVGLPVDLLRQRPDIRQAERTLASSTALIGVATAEIYPQFSLSGSFAFQAHTGSELGNFNNRSWSFGPSMRWNIFDGLRNVLRVEAAEALTEQNWARYQQTVLSAMEEVESSLVAYKKEQDRRDQLQTAVDATERAVTLVRDLYRNGLTDFQNVLDTQRSLFQQQDALAVSEGQVTLNLIFLYKALGGGWQMGRYPDDVESEAAAEQPEPVAAAPQPPLDR